jgi:two-component system sensor histidine kinase HydH
MFNKIKNKQILTGVPPWVLIGAVAVLLPIFTFSTLMSINRQKEKSTQLLLEKGAALIRSFEAGTRTGMMSMHRGGFQLQRLLTETAQQQDIVYLFVADIIGEILAHNDLKLVGSIYKDGLDLESIAQQKTLRWRQVSNPDGTKVFEVFQIFQPTGPPKGMMRRHMMMMGGRSQAEQQEIEQLYLSETPQIIFVGLDMSSIEEAHRADIRHAIIMGIILLLVGFSGITLLFVVQSYRTTKASLSRIKAFSDNVVENMPIGLIALDGQQRIAAFNHTAESVLQQDYREVMGKEAEQVLPQELCAELKYLEIQDQVATPTLPVRLPSTSYIRPEPSSGRIWEEVQKRKSLYGQVIEKEINCTLGDGKIVPLEVGASLLEDENKTFLGYVILFKDLTEVRSLRKEIERSRRLASVGRLAAGVAHEIRNPLSSIKGFATYFKERYQQIPEDQNTANIMIQEVDRLNRVVGQLLEFARPVKVSPQPMSLKNLIDDSVRLVAPQAQAKQITVRSKITAQMNKVFIDPDRINQVLLNLYLNAIESMQAGGELDVQLSYGKARQDIKIRVSDTGCGIQKDDLTKIFDPYFTTKSSGTGLGLAIAHNIVEAMGGTIKVESQPGKGTIFTIRIPNSDESIDHE